MDDAARPTLDVYDVACLAGGPDRMVDTALVALIRSGRVRVARPGELEAIGLDRRHPVEAAVLDALGSGRPHSLQTIRWRAAGDPRLAEVTRRLLDAGLLSRGWGAVVLRERARPVVSRAGRRALDEAVRAHAEDDEAWRVAVQGRQVVIEGTPASSILDQPQVDRRIRGSRLTARMDELARDRRYHGGPPQP
jgi:hypothetical protein